MRVPNSPHSLKKVMATGKSSSSEGEDSDGTAALSGVGDGSGVSNIRPPRPKRNKSKDDFACAAAAAAMNVDGDSGRSRVTQSLPREMDEADDNFSGFPGAPPDVTLSNLSSGFHRSRERTRKSAVLKLLERKQAEREKEKERESRARSYDSLHQHHQQQQQNRVQSEWARDRSWARYPDHVGTKTYITIGPGKPTRIRENSPSKRNVASPRSGSPAKKRISGEDDLCGTGLKSASLLKDLGDCTEGDVNRNAGGGRKRSFVTQRTIIIGNDGYAKLRSKSTDHGHGFKFESTFAAAAASNNRMDLGRDSSVTSSGGSRSSEERECGGGGERTESLRLNSSRSSSFSNLSEAGSSDSSDSSSELSKRRESLERRFRERSSVPRQASSAGSASSGSSEDGVGGGGGDSSSASSRLLYNLSSGYRYHRAAAAAAAAAASSSPASCGVRAAPRHRRFSQDHGHSRDFSSFPETTAPMNSGASQSQSSRPRSRKISVPLTCYEHPERSVQQARSLADAKKDEGNELYKTKKYRDALQRYSEAISLDPECPSYYGNRSACHMMLSQYQQALEDARTSVSLDSAFVKGYIRIAKCCLTLGDAVSAGQALDKASHIEPKNAAVMQERNNASTLDRFKADFKTAYDAKDFRKALFCLDRALATASACRQLKIARAECLAFLGRYEESQEVANDLLRADAMNADAIYVRGLCLYYEDNVDKAFTHFQQVLRLAPDHQKAKDAYKKAKLLKQKKDEGNAVFKSAKWSEAYDLYSEALQIDPCNRKTNAKLYFNRAIVAAKMKKYKESVADCNSALSNDENYLKAILRRAASRMELEEYEAAVADYEKAHRMDRSNGETRRLLQHAKLELKKSKRKDYYKILGVDKGANEDEIKKAYRKRALVHHPDRHANATEDEKKDHEKRFKEVGEAYGVLSDRKKRTRYDNGHDLEDLDGHGGHQFSQDIDPNQIFQAFFGGAGGGGGGMGGAGAHHFGFGGPPGAGGGGGSGFTFQFG